MCEKGFPFIPSEMHMHTVFGLWLSVLYRKQPHRRGELCSWLVQFLLIWRSLGWTLLEHLLPQTDSGGCFSALLCSCVCSKVQKVHFDSQCVLVEAHRKVVGGNSGIPVTGFIVFHFYLILTGPSAMLIVDSALSPFIFLILLLVISFCPLSFCTWCCFFHADRELS